MTPVTGQHDSTRSKNPTGFAGRVFLLWLLLAVSPAGAEVTPYVTDADTFALYHLDEPPGTASTTSGVVADSSGNGNDLFTTPASPFLDFFGPAGLDGAASLQTDRQFYRTSGVDFSAFNEQSFTLECWIHGHDESDGYQRGLMRLQADGEAILFGLQGGSLRFGAVVGGNYRAITSDTYDFDEDQWYHLAVTYEGDGGGDDSVVRFYVDPASEYGEPGLRAGTRLGGDHSYRDLNSFTGATTNEIHVGSWDGSQYYLRELDEVRISSAARDRFALATEPPGEPGIYDVTDYGAAPNDDTDDSAAFQAALDGALAYGGGIVHIPAGDYHVGTCASRRMDSCRLTLRGQGIGVTTIYATGTGGVFRVVSDRRGSQITVRDMTVLADRPGAGTAFDFWSAPGGNVHARALIMEAVDIRSADPSEDYFDIGINAFGVWRPLLQGVNVAGPYGPGVSTNLTDSSPLFAMQKGIVYDNCYGPAMQDCEVYSAHTGISCDNSDPAGAPEGGTYIGCSVESCRIGLHIYDKGHEPGLMIDGCRFRCRDTGILMEHRKLYQITSCQFVGMTGNSAYPYVDLDMDETYWGIISDCVFGTPTHGNRTMIRMRNGCYDTLIVDNRFVEPEGQALDIDGSCFRITTADNAFE
ncbi:LamG-like jellyroll fold domain-containing protein [Kiritimatiella glycovorans]|uniref:Glycoside hydrolase family protein n=1 Tax=Kiritimatiella glycovorans TaxID=1307763 RepID=A0A0G3EG09_9BACT|nr:LamG-like jellyroll fold domain-containing protein [Kiritimatiella glycovorans]AKJ65371.1 Glycoside hydrolase family protein [Kiritimatiella glycovorans]